MKKYMDLEEMSKVNCSSVLNVIREAKEISRKEISDITGLSWGGMTKIVNKLFEKGYIEETKNANATGVGRTPGVITICRDQNVVIGLDINNEGLEGCVINLAGEVLEEYSAPLKFSDKEELLETIITFASNIVKENNKKNILSIGVAMQGMVDVNKGISIKFPGCPSWENVSIKEILENHLHYPVYIEHDPNCMLYAAIYNNPEENCVLFRIDRSIGMAVTVDGNVLQGNGLLEVAHTIAVPGGRKCHCGKRGCVEAYLKACLDNNEFCDEAIEEASEVIAVLMHNMSEVFNASKIILAGTLMDYKEFFEEKLLSEFAEYNKENTIEVVLLKGTKNVVYGAAMIAVQGAIDQIEI